MPMGEYKDFDECVKKVMEKKGFSKERAQAYCGEIKKKVEKNNKSNNIRDRINNLEASVKETSKKLNSISNGK